MHLDVTGLYNRIVTYRPKYNQLSGFAYANNSSGKIKNYSAWDNNKKMENEFLLQNMNYGAALNIENLLKIILVL